ncbi:MAG: orotidine-5'-phosphate decarboxylase [Patescibacteria group bacterium]|nr:orotidine-5'-phosphate decarboxylase [Patescibacteria group bacterium]MDD5715546.1 orotidine-5'-phosphate decarboxylase [Patescibacteria group bacterium]
MDARTTQSYTERAKQATNPVAKQLFELMEQKKTNLCLANDESDVEKFLGHIEQLGEYLAVLKMHVDILENFTPGVIVKIRSLAKKHNFLIFEDRKFADIGNTVSMQYEKGVYKIAEWAHLTNCHVIPGPGIIEGLKTVADKQTEPRGLILLAQMSSKGNLATDEYTAQAVTMAEHYPGFIVGFIGNGGKVKELKKLSAIASPQFIILTPGVNLTSTGDKLGQQYTTPADVIAAGADVIIVGRGIYSASDPIKAAEQYRAAGWEAYLKRITNAQ